MIQSDSDSDNDDAGKPLLNEGSADMEFESLSKKNDSNSSKQPLFSKPQAPIPKLLSEAEK